MRAYMILRQVYSSNIFLVDLIWTPLYLFPKEGKVNGNSSW